MFLKRIELIGFKSFADRTELEFVPGITAVVGPNGSGKSNISDGIRWVLGEQSAKSLRGAKMEDIIFAGSDGRKSVNYGEVSLTLDNSAGTLPVDYSEVTVTRRVYRSGDSEYSINKQTCRLKDITELFMDTGVGKEAYSIIGQGRIEEILSTKSEDRRGIFEEAAGIVKYKSRKKEAQRKLDETEQNLLRISDLIGELDDQVGPLGQQAEKAKQFKLLREQLKVSEISLYVHTIGSVHRQWEEANRSVETLGREQLELSSKVSQRDSQLEKKRWESKRLEEELEQLQAELVRLIEDTEKHEGMREVLKEREKNQHQNQDAYRASLDTLTHKAAERESEMEALQTLIKQLTEQLSGVQQTLKKEELKLQGVIGGLEQKDAEMLKADLLDLLNEMASHRNELRHLDQLQESSRHRLQRITNENRRWLEQKEAMEQNKQQVADKLDLLSQEIEKAVTQYQSHSRQFKEKQQLLAEVQQMWRKWQQKLDALISRRDTMQEMQSDFDGFFHGVKEVLRAREQAGGLTGIHGAVAELIQVPETYETAIEIALGGALQNIVVEDEAAGRRAIQYLKQRQAGRATFLPLNVIRPRTISDSEHQQITKQSGYVGIASQLVKYENKYQLIFSNLLGQVIVSETLEDANRIAAASGHRYRVVTLDGDVVNPGGSMTGGGVQKKTTSLLGRQRQIEHLAEEIESVKNQMKPLEQQESRLKEEITELEGLLDQLREQGESSRKNEQEASSELQQFVLELKNIDEHLSLYYQDRLIVDQELEKSANRYDECSKQLIELEKDHGQLQQQIAAAEQSRKVQESERDETSSRLTDLKVQAAKLAQEKETTLSQRHRVKAELEQLLLDKSQVQEQLDALVSGIETGQSEEQRLSEMLVALHRQKQSCGEQIEYKRAERHQFAQALEKEESEIRDLRHNLRKVEETLRQSEVKANRLDVELDNSLKKLAEEYELSYELAKQRYAEPEDVAATQNEVRELKRKITLLGDVNLGAIEEFERVTERLQFLTMQRNDLNEAKATLYQVIREMDIEMSKRFRETFEAIRSHFTVVFAQLFGGGRANLILSEPDNVLETGIEIVAQPPGKKLQNLSLLSGGERALTAIALLFAILRVKPVPFCVLDEVEAALDEANVARFAHYLREFSGETQFIVVTHRKGTMEGADVLYGVTMQESGVSKLVSVRLEEMDELTA